MSIHVSNIDEERLPTAVPPLQSGDRLSSDEFERRYVAHPEIKKAELIEGVVYMASPVRYQQHGRPHARLMAWLGFYWANTSGVEGADNVTLWLDRENVAQPDALLRRTDGPCQVTADDYLLGPPELIIEVAASSAAYDLHDKKQVYARHGVQEYLVLQVYEQKISWFSLREGTYELLPVDEQGVVRSDVFTGLWLNTAVFWQAPLSALLATLQEGLASRA